MNMVKDISQESVTLWGKVISFGAKILLALWAFLAPIFGVLVAVGAFIILDTITGVWKAKKLNRKVTSRKLSKIINKMLVYQATVITIFVLDYFIMNEVTKMLVSFEFALTKIVAVILCSIEAYSIDESYAEVTGKGLFERFKDVLSKYKKVREDIKDINTNGSN